MSIESIKRIIDKCDNLLDGGYVGENAMYIDGYHRGINQCIVIAETELHNAEQAQGIDKQTVVETMKLKGLGKITPLPESVAERHWLLDHITYLDVLNIIDEELDIYVGTDTLLMDNYDRGFSTAMRLLKARITLHAQTPRDMQ